MIMPGVFVANKYLAVQVWRWTACCQVGRLWLGSSLNCFHPSYTSSWLSWCVGLICIYFCQSTWVHGRWFLNNFLQWMLCTSKLIVLYSETSNMEKNKFALNQSCCFFRPSSYWSAGCPITRTLYYGSGNYNVRCTWTAGMQTVHWKGSYLVLLLYRQFAELSGRYTLLNMG